MRHPHSHLVLLLAVLLHLPLPQHSQPAPVSADEPLRERHGADDEPLRERHGAVDEPSTLAAPIICGPNGFRCLDDRFFQMCAWTDIDGQVEEPDVVHECPEQLACDEENDSYCGPRLFLVQIGGAGEPGDRRCETKFKREEGRRAFECEAYGMFADPYNASMFWFCDRGSHEHRFNQRHMLCGQQRLYDNDLKKCVRSRETPPIIRDAALRQTRQPASPFTCHGRALGKYADPNDCRQYFMCVQQKRRTTSGHAFRALVFRCTSPTMAYDPIGGQCSRPAVQRCSDKTDIKVRAEDAACHCADAIRPTPVDADADSSCMEKVLLQLLCPQCQKPQDRTTSESDP